MKDQKRRIKSKVYGDILKSVYCIKTNNKHECEQRQKKEGRTSLLSVSQLDLVQFRRSDPGDHWLLNRPQAVTVTFRKRQDPSTWETVLSWREFIWFVQNQKTLTGKWGMKQELGTMNKEQHIDNHWHNEHHVTIQ